MRRSAALIVAVLGALTASAQDRSSQPLRAEVNYIRVDMYPTLRGKPVEDLLASDVEIADQGVPQKIDSFERVRPRGAQPQPDGGPVPAGAAATSAEGPRPRLFVLFLDTLHVEGNWSRGISQPLINALNALITTDDRIALMTPEMRARDLTFVSRTTSIEEMLRRSWGRRDSPFDLTPEEAEFAACYRGNPYDRVQDEGIAQEMILRRREQRSLNALEALVEQLGTLEWEGRKAVITISNGWRLFDDDGLLGQRREIPPPSVDGPPPIGGPPIGAGRPVGRPPDLQQTGAVRATPRCEAARLALGALRGEALFREILDRANRTNTSFYPIDPRRVAVFDEDIVPAAGVGWNPPVGQREDRARLRDRHTALLTMAESTDGLAVVNTSDIDASLQRINEDLSSYYLLGFYSTQKQDGKFHRLTVRVKRPGVQVRARRGYFAVNAPAAGPGRPTGAGAAGR
jgi:VWFA-related protein